MDAKELIKAYFSTDFTIELYVTHPLFPHQELILQLESDAYYWKGLRYKGQHRYLIVDCEENSNELYDEFERQFHDDYFYRALSLEDCLELIDALIINGYEVS